ncbi:hypothetical protein F4815DRAFT_453548 [Daldinia loculata]|nr:hypothetical protein F4815DRAFT_453548 [Daldinia loculata]
MIDDTTFQFPIVCLVLWRSLCRSLCCLWPKQYIAVSLATSYNPRVRPPREWHGFTAVSVVLSVNLTNGSPSRPPPAFQRRIVPTKTIFGMWSYIRLVGNDPW